MTETLVSNAPEDLVGKNTHAQCLSWHLIPEFFDVKFYPYDPVGADPVFAAVSKKHVCQFITPVPLRVPPVHH